jgi:hypothetical protein
MTPLQLAQSLMEAAYDYASTDIKPTPEMSDFVLEWNKLNIPEDVLQTDDDGGKGREREPHITIKYGLLADEVPDELREIAKDTPPFPVFLGTVSLFTTSPKFDVVKIDVESPWLRELNRRISDAVPHEDTHPTYNPHMTLAYVQKGSCEHLVGDDPFKAEGVTREFMAYGMNFSGAGDDDLGRAKESLLFSKVKKAAMEAVVGANADEIAAVERIIQSAVDDSNGDVSVFTSLANDQLAPYHIRFAPHEAHKFGPAAVATPEGVFVPVPNSFQIKDYYFSMHMAAMLQHELVHDRQMGRSPRPQEMYDKALAYVTPGGRVDHDRYLQQKQEIMAWAASLVDAWRRQGLTAEQMMRRLRGGNWGYAMKYWHNRHKFPQTFNRFVKQATEYIQQLGESAFAETVTGLDPFAHCGFPVDPDRIKQFLQRKSKPDSSMQIL